MPNTNTDQTAVGTVQCPRDKQREWGGVKSKLCSCSGWHLWYKITV